MCIGGITMEKNKRFSLNNMYLRNISHDHDNNMHLILDEKYINMNHDDQFIGIGRATLTFTKLKKEQLNISYYQDNHRKEMDFHEFTDNLIKHSVEVIEEIHGNNVSYFNCIMDKKEVGIKIHHDNDVQYQWELKR